jgi:hypothetical protein
MVWVGRPGASEIIFTELNTAYALASASQTRDKKPQQVVVRSPVSGGGRTYTNQAGAVFGLNRAR